MEEIIKSVEKSIKPLFQNGIYFYPKRFGKFISSGNDLSPAIDNYNNTPMEINVLKWFDDFWIYIEVNFFKIDIESEFKSKNKSGYNKEDYLSRVSKQFIKIGKDYFGVRITLSIFEGNYNKEDKMQLFRAEWDYFDNKDEHPQPHWHFYPIKYHPLINDSFETYDESNKEKGFNSDLQNEEAQIIDLKNVHFAMNADWSVKGNHIHKINNKDIIVNWFQGILGHIKYQLEYVK
jgi:hypothetical protein